MARYFAQIVDGLADQIVVGADDATTATMSSLLGGTFIETADPYASRWAYPTLGVSSTLVQPPIPDGVTVFDAAATKIVDTAGYTAWPYDGLNWDAARSKLWLTFMNADGHLTGNASVMFVTINTTTDEVSTPVEIISHETYRCICHATCIAANGDYLAFVMYRDTATNETFTTSIWRSTDGGSTWSDEGSMVDGEDVSVGGTIIHAATVLADGSIIANDRDAGTTSAYVHRSTDNGLTWSAGSEIPNELAETEPLEPAFWQHPTTGRVVAIYRAGLTGSQNNPLFTYSDDSGQTWATMFDSPLWWRQYNNPGAFVYHSDADLVEYFFGSRSPDALDSRISRVAASPDDVASHDFGGTDVLYGGAASGSDFGYLSAARVGSKVYVCWYDNDDGAGDTDIWMAVGTRPA